jgi:hypothetical protein
METETVIVPEVIQSTGTLESRLDNYFRDARERQSIYRKRQAGEPPPWTQDEVMKSIYLCNLFREQDKTTVWFRENVRNKYQDPLRIFGYTVLFRWFNRIETGRVLFGPKNWADQWFEMITGGAAIEDAAEELTRVIEREASPPYFTGAFMIKLENGVPKHFSVARAASKVLRGYIEYVSHVGTPFLFPTLQGWTEWLTQFSGLGGFMAYEIASDFRWTKLAGNSTDILTWANIGPGCARGLSRLYYGNHQNAVGFLKDPKQSLEIMQWMLAHSKIEKFWPQDERPWEMREVEHWCCEYDKICRARAGDGRIKRKYPQ